MRHFVTQRVGIQLEFLRNAETRLGQWEKVELDAQGTKKNYIGSSSGLTVVIRSALQVLVFFLRLE